MKDKSVREFILNYEKGKYDSHSVKVMIEAGWFDWFCSDRSLKKRLDALFPKVTQLAHTAKINMDTMYVFFKNNCPVYGTVYDDFRFCDRSTGDVIYTVVPASGHTVCKGRAELWGKENNFKGALVEGTWNDIKKFFGVENPVEVAA
jgi:hypothetical protein